MSTPEQHDDHVSTLYLYEDWHEEMCRSYDFDFPSWEDVVWSCTQVQRHVDCFGLNEHIQSRGCTCTKDKEMMPWLPGGLSCEYCLRKEKGWF